MLNERRTRVIIQGGRRIIGEHAMLDAWVGLEVLHTFATISENAVNDRRMRSIITHQIFRMLKDDPIQSRRFIDWWLRHLGRAGTVFENSKTVITIQNRRIRLPITF